MLVVEARLKGAGMHWTRAHADAIVAQRAVATPKRWPRVWPRIAGALCAEPPTES